MLKIINKRIENCMERELSPEQARFRKGRGTKDHIANLRWILEETREFQQGIYLCFLDYTKAFNCVDHTLLWIILLQMGIPNTSSDSNKSALHRSRGKSSTTGRGNRVVSSQERSRVRVYPLSRFVQPIYRIRDEPLIWTISVQP